MEEHYKLILQLILDSKNKKKIMNTERRKKDRQPDIKL
jgi:hypothetical protein